VFGYYKLCKKKDKEGGKRKNKTLNFLAHCFFLIKLPVLAATPRERPLRYKCVVCRVYTRTDTYSTLVHAVASIDIGEQQIRYLFHFTIRLSRRNTVLFFTQTVSFVYFSHSYSARLHLEN